MCSSITIWTSTTSSIGRWPSTNSTCILWGGPSSIPTAGKPQFFNAAGGDYRVFDLAAGRRMSSPTLGSADPRTDLGIPAGTLTNLLTNPGFETGLTGWTTQPGAATGGGNPSAFEGSSYFVAGASSVGFAQQTITLPYTPAQIDTGGLALVYGGRVRTAAEARPDQSTIYITFLDGSSNTISTASAAATNVADRWELTGDRVLIPVGTRQVKYRFETVLTSGSSNDGHLDAAFLYVQPSTFSPNQGAWGETADQSLKARRRASHSARLTSMWIGSRISLIRSAGRLSAIPVHQRAARYWCGSICCRTRPMDRSCCKTSRPALPIRVPSFGHHPPPALRLAPTACASRSLSSARPAFSIAARRGSPFRKAAITITSMMARQQEINIPSAVGSNRNTGQLASAPKSDINALLRLYTLGANDTLHIDTGTYSTFATWLVSASLGVGDDQGFTMTGPTVQG